ncbi:MAG: outer membrane protein assembly factor BamD [Planctomycetes bacterium]|nr:outer membrane protein assembly factor BamD [Planctomycetota bacterium]
MKLTILAMLVLSLPVFAGWKWDADEGFVEDPAVAAPGSPSTAEEYAAAGQFGRAAARYRMLAEAAGDDTAVKRVAWLKCGDARILIQNWADAYDAYENYLTLVETHAERMRGARFQVEACIMGVEQGAGFDFFGLVRGSQWAAKKGRELLTIYAYEDWSASARLRFAGSLLAADRFEESIIEYEFLLNDFPDSPWTPTARFRKAEAHLSQFGGMPYDPQPLDEARREFRRYLDDYPKGDKRDQAKARLEDLDALQAEKDWNTYKHYRHVRKWRSARLYLKEIVRKYPGTKWAEDAKEELPGLEKRISGMEPQDREKGK